MDVDDGLQFWLFYWRAEADLSKAVSCVVTKVLANLQPKNKRQEKPESDTSSGSNDDFTAMPHAKRRKTKDNMARSLETDIALPSKPVSMHAELSVKWHDGGRGVGWDQVRLSYTNEWRSFFEFRILQATGGTSKSLTIPAVSSSFKSTAAAIAGKNAKAPIYIPAKDKLKVCEVLVDIRIHNYISDR